MPSIKPAHTPGPWVWHDGHMLRAEVPDPGNSSVHTIISSDGGECGYLESDVKQTIAELDADRTLIAAAPDLLKALRETAAELKQLHSFYYKDCKDGCPMHAALAMAELAYIKATGTGMDL